MSKEFSFTQGLHQPETFPHSYTLLTSPEVVWTLSTHSNNFSYICKYLQLVIWIYYQSFFPVGSMAKHHPDLIMCRKQPGIAIGRLCEKCDGKCVICDSYVRPCTLVRVCDECNYGSFQGRCVICGGVGISDAYYCKECTQQEKDRDGCPKIVNLGSAKTDLFYERKKYGFKKRWYNY